MKREGIVDEVKGGGYELLELRNGRGTEIFADKSRVWGLQSTEHHKKRYIYL